jgi:hypothetical protein
MANAAMAKSILGISLAVGAAVTPFALAQTPFQPPPLAQFLKSNNWVALPLPDNKMRPGAVIKVTMKDKVPDVRWLGDFRSCGVTDQELGLIRGKYPPVGIGENFAVGASFVASLLSKFRISAQAEKVNGAILKIEESGGDAIDLLALSVWLTKPLNLKKLPDACKNFLAQEDVYLVSEAFRISKGTYELVDKDGGKLAVSAAAVGPSAKGEISGSVNSSGTLTVTEDFYFGVRRVKQLVPGSFATLGTSPEAVPEADSLLRLIEP